jgi:tetratricopeptide (TPR) repeat protein
MARAPATARFELPQWLIAAVLVIEVAAVYSTERWVLRGGLSPAAVHARQRIDAEIGLRFQQGVAMLRLGEHAHAITALHRVLELAPTLPEAHVNMGFAMLGAGRAKEARDFFAGALALRSGQANAHYGTALAADALGEREAAIEAIHRYVMETAADDPFRPKAEALLAAWGEALKQQRRAAETPTASQPAGKPKRR